MPLTADQFRARATARPLQLKEIRVPELDEEEQPPATVCVRKLTSAERDDWESELYESNGKNVVVNRRNVRARLAYRTLCDPAGALLYGAEDAAWLGQQDGKLLDRIYEAARDLNELTPADEEELEKNSERGPSAASGSGSAPASAAPSASSSPSSAPTSSSS